MYNKDTEILPKKTITPSLNPHIFINGGGLTETVAANDILASYSQYRVTAEKIIPPTTPIARIGEAPILAPGNTTPVTAESKAGKTGFKNAVISGAITKFPIVDQFKDLHIELNEKQLAVIDLDTEQSEADQQYNLKKSLDRAGLKSTPDNYLAYNIRTLPLSDYQAFTNSVCEAANEKFGGIYLIVVDGGADFITSVNDEAEANAIVSYFINLAVKYNCPVMIVIHLNENAGKNSDTMPRGHIGRQAVRKGYCQLNITKDGDISTLQVLRARKAGINDTPLICYKYDKEKGYHTSIDPDEVSNERQNKKDQTKILQVKKLAGKLLPPPSSFRYTDVINKIMDATKKSKATAKRMLDDWEGWGIVSKGEDGHYRLNGG